MNGENKMCLEWWMGKFTRPYFSTLRDYHSHVERENFTTSINGQSTYRKYQLGKKGNRIFHMASIREVQLQLLIFRNIKVSINFKYVPGKNEGKSFNHVSSNYLVLSKIAFRINGSLNSADFGSNRNYTIWKTGLFGD